VGFSAHKPELYQHCFEQGLKREEFVSTVKMLKLNHAPLFIDQLPIHFANDTIPF